MSLSLKQKTILGVALIEAVLLILLIMTALNFMREFNNEAMQKRANTAATLFATTTQDALLSYDLASLQSFADQMLVNPDIVYARVLNDNGDVFASSSLAGFGQTEFVEDELVTETHDGVYDVSAEILAADTVYGTVQIGIEISAIQETMNQLQRNISLIAFVEMGLVALFSYVLGSYLTRQLKVLQRGTNLVAEAACHGDFSNAKITIVSKDELADVATSFNQLVDNLKTEYQQREQYQNNLEEMNQTLEQKVEDRTRVLEKQNTLLQQTNKQLKTAQKQLLHAEKMSSIGQLAAGVAHEINNPVGYVISNLQTMQDYLADCHAAIANIDNKVSEGAMSDEDFYSLKSAHDLDFVFEDGKQLLEESNKGLTKVKEIVSGLKNFSHAGDDNFALLDMNKCIQDTLGIVQNQLKYHCEIRTELADESTILGNEGKICQVLTNLLINAGQAIEDNGRIVIRTLNKSGQLVVQIADNGCGIPEENVKKLFDPFFSTKPVGEGTGLGLAISYGIVKDHEGDIRVKSVPGKGTCFNLLFPMPEALDLKETTNEYS